MHFSARMFESHAELIDSDILPLWVRNVVVDNNTVTNATRNINIVVYFMIYFQ